MKFEKSTTMSTKRIIVSLLIYLLIPVIRLLLYRLTNNMTLSGMFALNVGAWLLVMYDWELFGLHWNRAKANLGDTILYTVIGMVFFFFWTLINATYLHGAMILPEQSVMHAYPIAIPAILFAFSFSLSIVINITFKCITDRFKVHAREGAMILLSGFLFGLIYTLTLPPITLTTILPTYLYNMITVTVLSYLYNQTHSFLPGMTALALVLLLWQILFIL